MITPTLETLGRFEVDQHHFDLVHVLPDHANDRTSAALVHRPCAEHGTVVANLHHLHTATPELAARPAPEPEPALQARLADPDFCNHVTAEAARIWLEIYNPRTLARRTHSFIETFLDTRDHAKLLTDLVRWPSRNTIARARAARGFTARRRGRPLAVLHPGDLHHVLDRYYPGDVHWAFVQNWAQTVLHHLDADIQPAYLATEPGARADILRLLEAMTGPEPTSQKEFKELRALVQTEGKHRPAAVREVLSMYGSMLAGAAVITGASILLRLPPPIEEPDWGPALLAGASAAALVGIPLILTSIKIGPAYKNPAFWAWLYAVAVGFGNLFDLART